MNVTFNLCYKNDNLPNEKYFPLVKGYYKNQLECCSFESLWCK